MSINSKHDKSTFYYGEYDPEVEKILQEKIDYFNIHSLEIKKSERQKQRENSKPVSGAWIIRSAEGHGMEPRAATFAKRFSSRALESIGMKSLNPNNSIPKSKIEISRKINNLKNKMEHLWDFYLPEWFKCPERLNRVELDLLDTMKLPLGEELVRLSPDEFYSYRACVCLAEEIKELQINL